MFAKNLDLIMDLTNTPASSLGMACHLDPSYVSRMRNGTRPLPKKPGFLRDMSLYFARHITTDYQRSALCHIFQLGSWPEEERSAARLLEDWLSGQEQTISPDLAPLLSSFSGAQALPDAGGSAALPKPKSYYYGPAGKQEAVLQFFDLVLKENTPQTLLLTSDEEMGWLYEDPAFSSLWLRQFTKVLRAGNRVTIVHSIGRNMNEMLEGVSKWLPVYTTGAVAPYFYPRLRDGILQRTLFLAPRTAAVTSVSVGQRSQGLLNELITDREALAALEREYQDFLSLCRPLMRIITLPDRADLWQVNGALLSAAGDMICLSDRPTLATMPRRVAQAMQDRAPDSDILRQWQAVNQAMSRLPQTGKYTEILPRHFDSDPPALPGADLLGAPGLRYTAEEWQAHLDAVLSFGGDCPGYAIKRLDSIPQNVSLIAKDGRGVIMTKTDAPGVAFALSEPPMVSSFWDYLNRLL